MPPGNKLTNFLFKMGATIVSVLGQGELISDYNIYGIFLDRFPISQIGEHDSKAIQHESEKTGVNRKVEHKIESLESYQNELEHY